MFKKERSIKYLKNISIEGNIGGKKIWKKNKLEEKLVKI